MIKLNKRPRIFISHSSRDRAFVENLALDLRLFYFDVWYADWEIAIGDSIVEKVFAGLDASDTLLIVLSSASVASRWVKEELDAAVMRRLSENDIRILPVLAETCDIPTPLKHIRYADFREDHQDGFSRLLDSLVPGRLIWLSLDHAYNYFCSLSDDIVKSDFETKYTENGAKLQVINTLLEAALNLRMEIEFRRARQRMPYLSFIQKISFLAEKGVDVRSQTWNILEYYSRSRYHLKFWMDLRMFALMLKERFNTDDARECVKFALERLRIVMHKLCFENWDDKDPDSSERPSGT